VTHEHRGQAGVESFAFTRSPFTFHRLAFGGGGYARGLGFSPGADYKKSELLFRRHHNGELR
jgi:hypothetical protein